MAKAHELGIEKGLSFGFLIVSLLSFSPAAFLALYIVLGQAHFLATYLYKYLAGRIQVKWVVLYVFIFAFLIYLFHLGFANAIIAFTGIIFFIHFAQDEVFLFGDKHTLLTTVAALPLIILYSGLLIEAIYILPIMNYFVGVSLVILLGFFVLAVQYKHFRPVHGYFLLGVGLLLSIFFLGIHVPPEVLFGSIVLLHYVSWYVNYFFKVRTNEKRRNTYLIHVVLLNVLAIGFYYVYTSGNVGFLQYVYEPIYFYIWTIMHILFSIRVSDYQASFRLPAH